MEEIKTNPQVYATQEGHDISTGGISRPKCTVEGDLIYRINNKIMFWDLANPSAGFLPV